MRSIREATALAGVLAIFAALAVCVGLSAKASAETSSLSGAAPLTFTASVSQLAPRVGVEPISVTQSDEEDARYETCNLFRQMIEGIDYLSTDEQQQLIYDMAEVVQYTGDPDLMQAVADMGQGWLDSNPQRFARGTRALSQICDVPYE